MISFRLADLLRIDECGKDSVHNKRIQLEGGTISDSPLKRGD